MRPATTLPIRAPRVTADDLRFVVGWLRAYEPHVFDRRRDRALEWLELEIDRRERRAHAARAQRTASR